MEGERLRRVRGPLRAAAARWAEAVVNLGGAWQREDAVMMDLWQTGVAETRAALGGPWPE